MNSSKIIIVLAALLLVAAVFTGCSWWGGSKGPDDTKSEDTKYVDTSHGGSIGDTTNAPDTNPLSPDYPLPPEDTGAESIEGDDTGKLDKPDGGSSVGLTYMKEAEIDLESGNVTFLFGNPSRSNQHIIVSIVITNLDPDMRLGTSIITVLSLQSSSLCMILPFHKLTQFSLHTLFLDFWFL